MAEETSTREVVVPIPATEIPAAESSVAPEDKEVKADTVGNGAKTEAVAESEVATPGANATEESTIAYCHLNPECSTRANHTSTRSS
jgi:hypothetical protein